VMAAGEVNDEELDALQEQENRDVDRAIRESEQERDVIQVHIELACCNFCCNGSGNVSVYSMAS